MVEVPAVVTVPREERKKGAMEVEQRLEEGGGLLSLSLRNGKWLRVALNTAD